MEWITTGREILPGRSIPIGYRQGAPFDASEGLGSRFRFLSLGKGAGLFTRAGRTIPFRAPAYFCLDEQEGVNLENTDASGNLFIYFHPSVLRADLDFPFLHGQERYELPLDMQRDVFWLHPFLARHGPSDGILFPSATLVARVNALMERMIAEAETQATGWWPCRTRSFFIEILFALTQAQEAPATPDVLPGELDDPLVRRFMLMVHARYQEKLTVESLARELGTNRTTLQERVATLTRRSVAEYLTDVRLTVAQALLTDTFLAIDEVAQRTGYASTPGFSRAFRARFGLAPSEHRRAHGNALLAE